MVTTLPFDAAVRSSSTMPPSEARTRARQVRLLLTDCDGVLTDGGVYYSERGEALRRFSVRDGMGVERLRRGGIATSIVTGERSAFAARRAAKLGLSPVFLGVEDKAALLPSILEETRCAACEVAYIGDDLNDLELIQLVGLTGLTGAPADAMPRVGAAVHYRCRLPGGTGAFREFAEWILALRGEGEAARLGAGGRE